MRKHASMLKYSNPLHDDACIVASLNKTDRTFDELTEHEVLLLQESFLVNGLHHVQVSDVESGRELVKVFLQSLDCYHNIACLTVNFLRGASEVTDLYSELHAYAREKKKSVNECVDEFMAEHFYYDFLWIERSHQVIEERWLESFMQKLVDFEMTNTLPVIVLHYDRISSKS